MIINQASIFFIFFLTGVIISIFFDFFRILRKSFKTKDYITYIEDIIFCLISGMILIYVILRFNNGELRLYTFIGVAFGCITYIVTISKSFIKINVNILKLLKKMISKFFLKPVIFFIINIKRLMSNILKKAKNIFKIKENLHKKKESDKKSRII